jgi:hypothetical protein
MDYSADQVWGLAVRADGINGSYVKEDVWNYETDTAVLVKTANKKLVKTWLIDNQQPTEDEIAQGREVRRYFNTFTMKVLMGKISDFERQALRIAQMDEFTGRNLLEFAIISCLPETARRDRSQTALKTDIYHSEQLVGAVGDAVIGDITVVSSRYSREYNRYKIQAWLNNNCFVDFWHTQDLQGEYSVKAKIKQQRDNKTTQLNYVKIVLDRKTG